MWFSVFSMKSVSSHSIVLPHWCILWTSLLDNLPRGFHSATAPSTVPWNLLGSPPVHSMPLDKPLSTFPPHGDWHIPWLLLPCTAHCIAIHFCQLPCYSAIPSLQISYCTLHTLSWMQMDCAFCSMGIRFCSMLLTHIQYIMLYITHFAIRWNLIVTPNSIHLLIAP